MEAFNTVTSTFVALPVENVDTDQIIPARFLKTTSKVGLGDNLFADWRYDGQGQPKPDFVLNRPDVQGAQVLVAGNNFGCGSSREHAPWALMAYGFRAVVSTYFADIFRNNALKNGLLPVMVDDATYQELAAAFENDPKSQVTIDLEAQLLTLPSGRTVSFPVEPFAKHCLLNGLDQMGFLRSEDEAISAYEAAHPGRFSTVSSRPVPCPE
jgi:3-isopropylmalate/(R)-2-methylmalate dehydratase small subunit